MKTKLLRKIRKDWDYFGKPNEHHYFYWYFLNKKTQDYHILTHEKVHSFICRLYVKSDIYNKWEVKKIRKNNQKIFYIEKNT